MGRVRVVSDTTHYLPREFVERLGIHQVSLYVNWQGRTDREIDLPDFDAYYAHLRTAEDMPTTSQPSVGDFLEVYEPILRAGDDIVSLHISGAISGTVQSAMQARDHLVEQGIEPGRIEIVDARTACGGLGALLLCASHIAERGGSAGDIVQAVGALREDLLIWFAVDTLEFLRRGGRIGAARAYVGTALRVKPILTLEEEITPVERVRTAGRAFERMVEFMRERFDDGCDRFIVQHVQDAERAERLVAAGREIFGNDPVWVSEIGPVIGTHVGPGLLGVCGVQSRLLYPG
jgi:DegV family protein with EDD domain